MKLFWLFIELFSCILVQYVHAGTQESFEYSHSSHVFETEPTKIERLLNKACLEVENTKKNNQADLNYLLRWIKNSENAFENIKAHALEKISQEHEYFKSFQVVLREFNEKNPNLKKFDLTSNVRKLLGDPGYLGILEKSTEFLSAINDLSTLEALTEEVVNALDNNALLQEVSAPLQSLININGEPIASDVRLSHHVVTILKATLLYLSFSAKEWKWSEHKQNLHLVYSCSIPFPIESTLSALMQADNSTNDTILHMPNAGFIFGGKSYKADCKPEGLDCSGFCSYALDIYEGLDTFHFHGIYELIEKKLNDSEASHENHLVNKYFELFDIVNVESASDLEHGDLIVWIKKGVGGHIVIFNGIDFEKSDLSNNKEIINVIEAARWDNFSKEGIIFSQYDLKECLNPDNKYGVLRLKK